MKIFTLVMTGCLMLFAGCTCTDSATIGGTSVRPTDGGVRSDGGLAALDGGATTGLDAGSSKEICGNGYDEDNNGYVDDGCLCTADQTQPCWNGPAAQRHVGACKDGVQTCTGSGELIGWSACGNVQLPTTEVPGNCVDEDCDGQAPGCPVGCGSELAEICDDGNDNNCDGKVDCADATCLSNAHCAPCDGAQTELNELCLDGIDNDCNGKSDCNEPGCSPEACTMCQAMAASEFSCADRVDDDCDGKIDCADPDCRFPGQCGCGTTELACHNGQDDDCDGALDCADVDCEICTPGAKRWCDEPNFCRFGDQTCQGDGTWGACHEVKPPDQCKRGGVFGDLFGTDYDQECCVNAGYCCQNYTSGGGSIGMCGNAISCKP